MIVIIDMSVTYVPCHSQGPPFMLATSVMENGETEYSILANSHKRLSESLLALQYS